MVRGASVVLLAACAPSVPDNLPNKLTEQGSCGDLFVFAANAADTLVLAINVDEGLVEAAHSAQQTTSTTITLPAASTTVTLTDGKRVTDAMCDDVVENPQDPRAEWSATSGTLDVAITPGDALEEARANVDAKDLIIDESAPFDLSWFDVSVGWLPG